METEPRDESTRKRFASWLVHRAERTPSKSSRRLGIAVGLVLFFGSIVFSLNSLQGAAIQDPKRLIVVIVVLAPLSVCLSAVEFGLSGRVVGHRFRFIESLTISVGAAAANILPIPGSYLVRSNKLRRAGSPIGDALGSTAAVGLTWIGVAGLVAGVLLAIAAEAFVGLLFMAGGAVALISGTSWLVAVSAEASRVFIILIVAVEAAMVLVSAARLFVVLQSLGVDPTPVQAVTLAVSSVLATGLAFFPAGLGIREVIAGALSPLVGLTPAVGVLAAAVNRIVGLLVLVVFALLLLRSPGRSEANSGSGVR